MKKSASQIFVPRAAPWAWLAAWLFLGAFLNIAVVILGDSYELTRQALLATATFRFFMWFFLIVLIDLAQISPDKVAAAKPLEPASVSSAAAQM